MNTQRPGRGATSPARPYLVHARFRRNHNADQVLMHAAALDIAALRVAADIGRDRRKFQIHCGNDQLAINAEQLQWPSR